MEGYICQNCGEDWAEASLLPINDIFERVQPGDMMPDGECPECGGVCFADETPEEQARERVRNAGQEILAALEDATARLQSFIGSDCECDNTHTANNTLCCLCEYRAAIARAKGQTEEDEMERARR